MTEIGKPGWSHPDNHRALVERAREYAQAELIREARKAEREWVIIQLIQSVPAVVEMIRALPEET